MFSLKLKVKCSIAFAGIIAGTFLISSQSFAWDPASDAIKAGGDAVGGAGEKIIDAYKGNTRLNDAKVINNATLENNEFEVGGTKNVVRYQSAQIEIANGARVTGGLIKVKSTLKRNKTRIRGTNNTVDAQMGGISIH